LPVTLISSPELHPAKPKNAEKITRERAALIGVTQVIYNIYGHQSEQGPHSEMLIGKNSFECHGLTPVGVVHTLWYLMMNEDNFRFSNL
jgi:hypothetical protein